MKKEQKISISKSKLARAAENGIISPEQADNLWGYLKPKQEDIAPFSGLNVAYYFGGVLTIIALIWFANEAFKQYHTTGLFIISLVYLVGFSYTGHTLFTKRNMQIPGGILLTCSVLLFALLLFCIQDLTGLWKDAAPGGLFTYHEWMKNGWFWMEAGTFVAAIILLRIYSFPFLTVPLIFSLGFIIVDLFSLYYGNQFYLIDNWRTIWSVQAIVLLSIGYAFDMIPGKDYSFWFYLYGCLSLLPALHFPRYVCELESFLVFLFSIFFTFLSVPFRRRVFLVYGIAGVYIYIIHLAEKVFMDSLLFPLVLTLVGISIIGAAVWYTRNKEKITAIINSMVPAFLHKFIPPEH